MRRPDAPGGHTYPDVEIFRHDQYRCWQRNPHSTRMPYSIPFGGADGVQAVRLLSARPATATAMVMVVKAVSPINGVLWSMVMPRPTSSTAIAR